MILDPATGLLDGTSIGSIAGSNTYNGFGEMDAESYTVGGAPLYEVSYVRDKLGRIVTRTEMIEGETSKYDYAYGKRLAR